VSTVSVLRFPVGDATLVRVPYVDILIDAESVGLTPEAVAAQEWAVPTWAEGGQVRVAAAVWIIESDGRRIVVDPTQTADDILRAGPDAVVHQEAIAGALAAAGYPRESIDTVVATHIDGIGLIAWREDDAWVPSFPNADFLLSRAERDAIAGPGDYEPSGSEALLALDALGAVTTVEDRHAVTPEVTLHFTGRHSPGHQLVDVESGGERATMIGHLALSPVHCATGDGRLHLDVAGANEILRTLADGRILVGPLWPAPGAIRWTDDGIETVAPG
jgi:glyoxylase-like metal-dependent hydrolase (beta-lactamase superfamily II)